MKQPASLPLIIILWLSLGAGVLRAQPNGCSGISFTLDNYQACCYRLQVNNTSECYPALRLLLDAGSFAGWAASTQTGWTGELITSTELLLTHSGGFVPLGASTPVGFCLPAGVSPLLTIQYEYACPLGKSCIAEFPLDGCPIIADGCISGFKYADLGCAHLPYTNQPTLPGWTITLADAMGNALDSMVTDAAGAYSFCELAPGNYVVKETSQPGWTASVPPSGQHLVTLSQSELEDRNFGNCPACSCDSLYIQVAATGSSSPDTCAYSVVIQSTVQYCINKIKITTGAGKFANWTLTDPGWAVSPLDSQQILLLPPGGYVPYGASFPVTFNLTGSAEYNISVSGFLNAGGSPVECKRTFVQQCPIPSTATCCPAGTTQGPELVVNGDFTGGGNWFFSGYPWFAAGQPKIMGRYSVLKNNEVFAASSGWGGLEHTVPALPNGRMMVVDGQNFNTTLVWQQTINVQQDVMYAFCAWGNNLLWPNLAFFSDPTMSLWIDNSLQASLPLPEVPDMWTQVNTLWQATFTGAVNIEIRLNFSNTIGVGHDFAIDDISFRSCSPPACQAAFNVVHLDACNTVAFTNTSINVPSTVQYCWDFDNNPSTCESTAANPTWQFPTCGPYNVCLTMSGNGCSSSVCQTVTFNDTDPPIANCAPGAAYDLGTNCILPITPAMIDGGSTDNCQIKSMTVDPTQIPCGIFPVTLTVTDWCGNSSTCTTGIQASEAIPPTIFCPPGLSANCNLNVSPAFAGTATATDNCTAANKIIIGHSDVLFGTIDCDDYIERTWTAKDLCDNISSCVQVISVKDNIPPVIANCPPNVTVGMDAGQCYYTLTTPPGLVVTDNCDPNPNLQCTLQEPSGIVTALILPVQMTKGGNKIRCTATDDCGNVSLPCTYIITVIDNQQPTLSCPQNVTVQSIYDAAGQCKAIVNNIAPTATDNCPIPSLTYLISTTGNTNIDDASGELFPLGFSTVTYTLLDCGGFTKTCSFTVKVECPPCTPVPGTPCANPVNLLVACIPGQFGQYDFSFQVQNQAGFPADRIELTAVTPAGSFVQTIFNVNLPNNTTSGTLMTTINGVPGATVCFKISLQRTASNGVVLECCETAAPTCVPLPECPTACNCLGADNLVFSYTGFTSNVSWTAPVPVSCNNQTAVVLPCVPKGETGFRFGGVVHCDAADCLLSTFSWELSGPNGAVIIPGGPGSFNTNNGQDGYFDLLLFSNNLTTGVTYTIKLTWYCGGKICSCEVKFQLMECDCQCGSPISNLAITTGNIVIPLPCGSGAAPAVPCPPQNSFVKVTGKFQCQGGECLPGQVVHYTLTGPNGQPYPGGVLATPNFGITLQPPLMYLPGLYTLTMQGECNGHLCTPCTIKFYHYCPEPCPCPDATFNNRVDQGFSVVSSGIACQACFVPKQLDACESVEWFVNSVGPIGTPTVGNAPFCYTFASTATYNITMKVTRKNQYGVFCAMRAKTLQQKILCDGQSTCSTPVVSNPDFDENPVAGGLNAGGSAPGWKGAFGNPMLKQVPTALGGGWAVALSGNRDSSDVLSRENNFCWVKDSGRISIRLQTCCDTISWVKNRQPGESLVVRLYRGNIPNPNLGVCEGENCLEFVAFLLPAADSSQWYTLEIPYDLTAWAATDSCGSPQQPPGVWVNPVIFVTNWLGSESGLASETRSTVVIDHFCFEGELVGTQTPAANRSFRIFPNPNPGTFSVELPTPAGTGLRFRIVGLMGQGLREQAAQPGTTLQTVQAGDLPAGLYFLQAVSAGRVLAVEKFVKE